MKNSSGSSSEKTIKISPMDILFKEGDSSNVIHLIKRGKVLIVKKNTKENIAPLMVLTAPFISDDLAITEQDSHFVSAIALTDIEAVTAKRSEIVSIIEQMPDWAQSIINTISDKLREASLLVVDHAACDEETQKAWDKYSKSILSKLK